MMSRRKAKHTHRSLTEEERARVLEGRVQIASEEQEIRSKAREYKEAYEAARSILKDSLKQMRAKAGDGKPRERG